MATATTISEEGGKQVTHLDDKQFNHLNESIV
ncbi:hypothetical protein NIES4072_42860 [Nostoc commune NIES-4072]|uniref:Uncharacterized protein n=1 Tax=Nostoc commune NIES-4072 TaxID=2005467 RepID=A0A2R5FQM5_NOSCO|nr:hypothetical protein NIES4070_47970 [Nostoc commune HK-02]GBG20605.1 hypothetical protein NIES4072_42860 [Nostoc commune NIES-4072]